MSNQDEDPDRDADEQRSTSTRRSFLSVAAVGGSTVVLGRVFGQSDGDHQIEFGGETAGWVGRRPANIEGETNPTVSLTAGVAYQVTWENVDGAPHNFVVEDGDGNQILRTEIISEEGATQTVEFTATEEMAEYVCEVHPNTMRGDIEVSEATPTPTPTDAETPERTPEETDTPDETPEETETPDGEEPPDEPGFQDAAVEEHRGDVARFTVWTGGADEVELVLGSEDVNFTTSFTAVDGTDDEEVTVAVDTFAVGRSEDAGVSAPGSGDEIQDYQLETQTLSSPLDAAAYPLELYVDGELVDLAVLVLEPRETREARSGVAPLTVAPGNRREFVDAVTVRDKVATDDWAVAEFDVTGIYAAFDGGDAFEDESLGYELTVEQTEVVNAVPETVPLENIEFVVVEESDRFYAVVDSDDLEVEESYEATFALTDANPYVPDGEREEVSTRFTVVERTASFDADEPLTVPSGEATVSGTTTVAPGSTITVTVRGSGDRRFLKTAEATIEADGSWSATFDFSDVEPGTAFTAEVDGLSGVVDGEVT